MKRIKRKLCNCSCKPKGRKLKVRLDKDLADKMGINRYIEEKAKNWSEAVDYYNQYQREKNR